jgi:MraZ protein
MIPTVLRKQLPPEAQEKFVINRGFEKCLVLYPMNDWQKISADVNQLNEFVKKNREFVRFFHRGATEIEMDNTGRILLPKRLLEFAGIDKELVIAARNNKFELWAPDKYEILFNDEPDGYETLAEDVMGKNRINKTTGTGEVS